VTTSKNVFAAAVRTFKKLAVFFCIYLLFLEFCCAVHKKTTYQNNFVPSLLCSFLWYSFFEKIRFWKLAWLKICNIHNKHTVAMFSLCFSLSWALPNNVNACIHSIEHNFCVIFSFVFR
jgi:hypothetical protein